MGFFHKVEYNAVINFRLIVSMLRTTLSLCIILWSSLIHAISPTLYQVDMIVFTHHTTTQPESNHPPLIPDMRHSIALQNTMSSALTPYHTLPTSASQLNREYWALNRKTNYQVIAHYSWLQPANNQRAVAISAANQHGWSIEGSLRIRRSNYYLLDTDLLFSKPNNEKASFIFSQKQRLKPGTVYYLDHAQAGMLIKVHQIN